MAWGNPEQGVFDRKQGKPRFTNVYRPGFSCSAGVATAADRPPPKNAFSMFYPFGNTLERFTTRKDQVYLLHYADYQNSRTYSDFDDNLNAGNKQPRPWRRSVPRLHEAKPY